MHACNVWHTSDYARGVYAHGVVQTHATAADGVNKLLRFYTIVASGMSSQLSLVCVVCSLEAVMNQWTAPLYCVALTFSEPAPS